MSILTPINKRLCKLCSSNDLTSFIKITGAMGQALSSLAFIGSVATNDELPQKQKAFLTLQEVIEGVINVSLFCLFTSKAKHLVESAINNKKNIFYPSSIKNQFRGQKLFSENQELISKLEKDRDSQNFMSSLPAFAGFAGSVGATAIISPIMKNITSAIFLKAKNIKDKKDAIERNRINTQSLRKRILPLDNYITTVTSPKGMKI